ncbi:MAG: TonB-dependent receptor, partial [Fibrobacterales bacterium]|nr:TonB-dependent receptor [Fibrobacterales bacterium]
SLSARPARFLRLSAAGAWTRALDRGPSHAYRGKLLPNSPEWEGKFGSALFRGPWELDFDASWTSGFYRDRANRNEAESALQLSSGIRFDLSRNVRIRFRAEDLLDRAPESAYSSYPRPGRRFLVGLRALFPATQTTPNQRTEHAS